VSRGLFRVVTSQYGGGQSAVYLDSLGRTIRTASKLKDAGYQAFNFSDTGASVTETRFYPRGLVQWQYQPNRSTPNYDAATYFVYDALGRPTVKKETFNRVNQSSVQNAGVQHRRTEYTHTGLSTSIRVCQRLDDLVCAASGSNTDGSPILNMKRSFDSAGKLLSTEDANAKSTHYWFDGVGNPLQIKDVVNLLITATYNNFGHRTSVTDPDRGTWNFTYNGLGELIKQCDARVVNCNSSTDNYITRLNYDVLGRLTSRTWREPGRTNSAAVDYEEANVYENASNSAYGNLLRTMRTGVRGQNQAVESWSRRFDYDGLNRVTQSTTRMQLGSAQPTELVMQTQFDRNYGRVKQMVYPRSAVDGNAVSTYAVYDELGVLTREGFAQDYNAAEPQKSPAIRVLDAVDGRGLPVRQYLGARAPLKAGSTAIQADWEESNQFDSSGWLLARCIGQVDIACALKTEPTGASANPLHEAFRYDVYGNLIRHTHGGVWLNPGPLTGPTSTLQTNGAAGVQAYVYDALHRLITHTRSGNGNSETVNYGYNEIGGLRKKTDYSANHDQAYSYLDNTHRLTSVSLRAGGSASFQYDSNGNISQRQDPTGITTLQYDVQNLPRRIDRPQAGMSSDFYEGPGGRYWQRLNASGTVRDTLMLEKTMEREVLGGVVKIERYYVAGQLMTIDSSGRKLSYLHQDRLGSNVAISEKLLGLGGALGANPVQVVEHRGFDPFGKALDGNWGSSNVGRLTLRLSDFYNVGKRNQRGFTGHEHLDEFELIHMNGRAYDYNLGRFYGVDPFVQFPSNSQSLNPCGYLMNNPLAGTDPTGYFNVCDTFVICSPSQELDQKYNVPIGAGPDSEDDNGSKKSQGAKQTSQTDGAKNGPSGIGAHNSLESQSKAQDFKKYLPIAMAACQGYVQPEGCGAAPTDFSDQLKGIASSGNGTGMVSPAFSNSITPSLRFGAGPDFDITLVYPYHLENPDDATKLLTKFESKVETAMNTGAKPFVTDLQAVSANEAVTIIRFATTKEIAERTTSCNCLDRFYTTGRTILAKGGKPNYVFFNTDGRSTYPVQGTPGKGASAVTAVHEIFGHVLFGPGHWTQKQKKQAGYMCVMDYSCGQVKPSDRKMIYGRTPWEK
jgi:RHS repeat-associated protein